MKKYAILGGVIIMLFGCSSPSPESFKENKPIAKVNEFYNGELVGWGMIQDWKGTVTQRFTLKMIGHWEGDKGTLKEYFVYDDGRKQEREWKFTRTGPDTFTGTAEDIVGIATAREIGNAINIHYVLQVPSNGSTWNLSSNDFTVLIDDNNAINFASLTKFGLTAAKLIVFIQKK